MGLPIYEIPTGVINGVNDTFFTTSAYTSGSLAIFLNGQLLKNSTGDPWTEINSVTGEFEIAADCIPGQDGVDDQLAVFYIDTTTAFVGSEVTEIAGSVQQLDTLSATLLANVDGRIGSVNQDLPICAAISNITTSSGSIQQIERLSGTITCL